MIPYVGLIIWITAIVKSFQLIMSAGDTTVGRRRPRVELQDDVACCTANRQHKRRKVLKLNEQSICHTNSLINHVNNILGWLEDDYYNLVTIGVYGMGGVGKTVVAKCVHDQVRKYDVGWVSVGKDFNVWDLQRDIAKEFGIDLVDDNDETRRAAILYAFLSRNSMIVLFVDDLWGGFCRELVGIPEGCKMVLVSRSLDVCQMMRCQKVVKVEPLPQDEAWQLLCHSVKYDIGNFKENAESLCRECVGLPYAITSLAENMRGLDDDSTGSKTEESLRSRPIGRTILEDTFTMLRHSYDSLSSLKLKECFLHCALYPKGYAIGREVLNRLWIAVKLIDEALPLQVQYDMSHSIVNKLIRSCLVEPCGDKVKVHDLVRGMALSIAGDYFSVKAGMPLTEGFTLSEWQKTLRVASLINSAFQIPSGASPHCPNLSALLMQHNPLQVLPNSFFLNMPSLRILNLSYTLIEVLPNSISTLGALLVLDLGGCQKLKQVRSLENLNRLQFLNLFHTAIGQFPHCLQKLVMLSELNLSSVCKLKEFPAWVLPALTNLKKLSCDFGGTIPDLQSLKSLEVLNVRFESIIDLSIYVLSQHWRALEFFHLQVGYDGIAQQTDSHRRAVSLQGCSFAGELSDRMVLPDNIQELNVDDCRGFSSLTDILDPVCRANLRNWNSNCSSSLEVCTIRRCHDIENLFPSGWTQNLQQLEVLVVEDCAKIQELINDDVTATRVSEVNHSVISLPRVKKLELTLLPRLSSIYKGKLLCASVQSLSFINCPKLKKLPFSFVDSQDHLTRSSIELIEGQEEWWGSLQWNEAKTEALLSRLFKSRHPYPCTAMP